MKTPKEKKPFITVKEAIISVLVLLLFAIAFEKPFPIAGMRLIPIREVSEREVHQFTEQIKLISASEIKEQLTSGKPTLIFMYASWCGFCKKLMNNISSLKNEEKINEINFLPISVDKQITPLSRYLLERSYDKLFTPYIIDDSTESELRKIIIEKGGDYSSSIPYSIILDRDGNVLEEIHGTIDKISLLAKLNSAKNLNSDK